MTPPTGVPLLRRVAGAVMVLVVTAGCGAPSRQSARDARTSSAPTPVSTVGTVTSDAAAVPTVPRGRNPVAVRRPGPSAAKTVPPGRGVGGVLAVGDSVMIDAQPSLESVVPDITVDASLSRQVPDGIAAVQQVADGGKLGAAVVFALGTNGYFTTAELTTLRRLTTGRQLIIVTAHCPSCDWVAADNAMLRAGCTGAPDCRVADFDALAAKNPAWFDGDGVHMPLAGPGAKAYARLIATRLSPGS